MLNLRVRGKPDTDEPEPVHLHQPRLRRAVKRATSDDASP
jgi:hypothetical protein